MTTFKRFLTLFLITTLALSAWADASVGTTLWAENWTGSKTGTSGAADVTASANYGKGTTVYESGTVTYAESANTVYVRNENNAGGAKPELLLSSGKTWTISGIPTGNAAEMSLTYKSNNAKSSVACSTTGVTITGSSGSYTITNSATPVATITLVFSCSGNTRIDDVSLTVTTAGSGSGGGDPTLSSISVQTPPTKVSYTEGEYFDPTGLVITRTYSNSTSDTYAYAGHTSEFSFTPSTSTALTTSDASVTITYGGKSTTQAITVTSGGGGGGGSTATFVWGTNPSKYASESSSETEGLVTFTGAKGTHATTPARCYSDGLRMYAGNTVTFSVPDGYVITKIEGYATFNYNNATGEQSVTFSGLSKATCGSDVTVTYSAAVSYTITASSNNNAYGTVSVSGNIITATPESGYIADGYTVTSGTATVSQSGNTYTVTPSEDCNVQINFRAAATYTVTIIDNGGSHNETATEGVPFELPDEGLSTCDDATLLGWATGEYTSHLAGTSTKPDYDAPGTSKTITANTIFTAVYGIVAPSNNYAALKLESDLESGANYVLAAYYSSNDYAMKATMSSDRVDTEVKSLVLDAAGNTITDSYLIWQINIVNPSTKAVTFYNAEINKYLVINGSNEIDFADDPIVFNYTVNTSGAAATWNFKSSSNAEYTLSFYTTYHQFNAYTSNSTSLYLYKQKVEVSNYTSKPKCCQAPSTPMAISSETTNFEGSGSTTISLTGGNGKPITWSCKDELDSPCDYLTGTSSTGATLTLPANAATKVYTVTASQADDETDPDNVICGATVTLDFTVKAQFTINFKTIDGGSESLYHSITVTDGDTYEMPSLAEDFDCGTSGKSFMGWASANDASSVEKTAGTIVTATAAATWYACWATSADVTLVPLYEKVTSASSLAASDIVLICNTGATVAIGEQNTSNRAAATVTSYEEESKDYVYFTGTDVRELTVGKDGDHFTFHDATEGGYLYAASSSSNHMKTQASNNDNGKWELVIAADGAATVTAQGTNSHKIMRYNTGNSIFSCYSSGQQAVVFYKKTSKTKSVSTGSGSITTDMDGCASGPTIRANTNQWITSAAGQTVKTVIDVTAKNFETAVTLSATSSNDKFFISLADTDVPTGVSGLTTTLTVEYTPTTSDETESSTITLKAGEITKTITVNGRTLPEEFLLITKKTLWYALPGNMNDGPGEYDGVVVTTDDPTTPTMVGVSPSTVLYSLKAVTSDRYADHGNCVRLVGYNDLCLWSNHATSEGSKINIQNKTNVATASGNDYEWLLTTTDGVQYTIANPNHPQYGAGRRLAYGLKFGLYTEPTIFYIVPAGCTSQPGEVSVSPRRVEATFSWVSNTTDMHIDLWTNEAMDENHKSATASSSPYVFSELAESTDYWYKLTPGTEAACAVTGSFKTTGPLIDIVEWQENGVVLFIDKGDINPKIVIDGQEEHGSISGGGGTATELFFSKYFEGAGNMKLLAIFNGTKNDIDLSSYSIYMKCVGNTANTWSPSSDKEYLLGALGTIKAGQEIIFFTPPSSGESPYECSGSFLSSKEGKSGPENNPRWIKCDGSTTYSYGSPSQKYKVFDFSGNDPILLKKGSDIIDVFGAKDAPPASDSKDCRSKDRGWQGTVKNMDYGKTVDDEEFNYLYEATSLPHTTTEQKTDILAGFGINLVDEEISICSARCILFRDKSVTSGADAVTGNTSDFATFIPDEWNGRTVCMSDAMLSKAGVGDDGKATCNAYQALGDKDYNQYYIDWNSIEPGKDLDKYSSDPETKEYIIHIDNMRQYACLKLRFQLVQGEEVLTEASQQVPIVVVGDDVDTNDPLFSALVIDKGVYPPAPSYSHSVERCKDCDVVILGSAKLTKGPDSDEKDVPEVGNVKVYPGGKLIVPTGTTYTMKSLALRRQEDEIATANIQGTITFKAPAAAPAPRREEGEAQHAKKAATGTKSTYFDLRIDPTNWHFISLPYDVNVSDIRFANPEETAIPVLGTDYLLQWYDGDRRAATKNDDAWEPVAADATLKAGLGYIFALPGSGKVKREFRFPMDNEVITQDKEDKIAAPVYGYGCDQTSLGSNHKGWNLVGAPYLMPYQSEFASPLRTGKIVEDYSPGHMNPTWDGSWTDNGDGLYYIAIPINNGWDYYYQDRIANYKMQPFTSYFVQIDAADPANPDPSTPQGVGFDKDQVVRSSIVRRNKWEYEEVEDNHPVWCQIDLTNPQGENDKTTVLISNKFTDDYDMMRDMVKMRGSYYSYYTRPVLASRNNEGEMAFNALPDSSALAGIPLNFFAAGSGSYTISFNERYGREEVKAVMLLDKNNNQWYNLLDEPYSFTTNRVNDKNRFVLSVRVERKKPQTPTDIVNPSVMGDGSAPRKILINNRVYILRGGKIYDVTGKQLLNL